MEAVKGTEKKHPFLAKSDKFEDKMAVVEALIFLQSIADEEMMNLSGEVRHGFTVAFDDMKAAWREVEQEALNLA